MRAMTALGAPRVPLANLLVSGVMAGFLLLSTSGLLFAHHGTAAYDQQPVTLKGTVTDFEFINPHCQIYFDVKNDKGVTEAWQGELTSPNKLGRAGWTKHSLKPGDTITMTGPAAKSGKHSIWIQKLIGPDGSSLPLSED